MKSLCACFSAELKKLAVRKKYTVLSIIFTLVALGVTGILSIVNNAISGSGGEISVNMQMLFLPILVSVILPLIAMMSVCDLFAGEYHNSSIKAQLMRPVTRFKIYISKLVASFVLCGIVAVVMYGVLAICGYIYGDASGVGYAAAAYALDMIPVFVLILMSALINQVAKSPVSAMFLCLIIYIGAKVLGYFSIGVSGLLFTSYMEWHRLWLGVTLPFEALLSKVSLILGYGITFFSGGYLLFIKNEF